MNLKKYLGKNYVSRYIMIVISVIMNGLGLSILRISCMGTDPFSSMNYSISESTGVSLGMLIILVNAVLIVFCIKFLPSSIGFGTIANMVILGNSADMWRSLIESMFHGSLEFSGTESFGLRILLMIIGICIMVFFNSFYISGELGMAPYDALGYIINKITKGKLPFQWSRVMTDTICVIIGYCIARPLGVQWELIGIGTIFMAFGTGPMIAWIRERIADPCYQKICGEKR